MEVAEVATPETRQNSKPFGLETSRKSGNTGVRISEIRVKVDIRLGLGLQLRLVKGGNIVVLSNMGYSLADVIFQICSSLMLLTLCAVASA